MEKILTLVRPLKIECQFCRCGCPIDASNPHAGALLDGKPICPRCIAGTVLPRA